MVDEPKLEDAKRPLGASRALDALVLVMRVRVRFSLIF